MLVTSNDLSSAQYDAVLTNNVPGGDGVERLQLFAHEQVEVVDGKLCAVFAVLCGLHLDMTSSRDVSVPAELTASFNCEQL